MRIVPASTLSRAELVRVFNAGYSVYVVALQLDEPAFSAHLAAHDVDLDASTVLVDDDEPAAFALVARRGSAAWVAGVGTAPAHRRRGLAARALTGAIAGLRDSGATHVDLEVIDRNHGAIALYDKLGFTISRDLLVWSLPAGDDATSTAQPVEVADAQGWIAAHRHGPEPWQRSAATTAAVEACGETVRAAAVHRDGVRTAAAVWHQQPGRVIVLQIAAADEAGAEQVVAAARRGERDLRLTNIEPEDPASRTLERLGASLVARQHEMRLAL